MVELARVTDTQLFCLTAINDRKITKEFDTVVSNQYIPQRGALLLDRNRI